MDMVMEMACVGSPLPPSRSRKDLSVVVFKAVKRTWAQALEGGDLCS